MAEVPEGASQANSPVPAEVKGWNWGAFGLNWIWGIGNETWIALLALIPIVNLVMIFVLGAKGNEWAWKNKHWDSVEHFKNTQRKWRNAWLIILGACVVLALIAFATSTNQSSMPSPGSSNGNVGTVQPIDNLPQPKTPPATQSSQGQFNPALVQAKQDCQTAANKWAADNTGSSAAGSDYMTGYYFNPSLNTCSIEDIYHRSDGMQMSEVLDIYANRKLLELDYNPPSDGPAAGMYLYQNGQQVNTSDPSGEYNILKAALFGEAATS